MYCIQVSSVYLENLTRSVRVLDTLNIPENGVDLIDNLPRDEAAEVQLNKLHESHA